MLLSPEGLSSKRFPDSGTQTQITCFFFCLKTMLAPSLPLTYELPLIKKVVYSGTQSTGGCSHTQTSKLFSAMYRCAALETKMEKVGADKSSHAESGQRWSWISCYTSNLIMITNQNQSSEGTCMDKKKLFICPFLCPLTHSLVGYSQIYDLSTWIHLNIRNQKPWKLIDNEKTDIFKFTLHVSEFISYMVCCVIFFFFFNQKMKSYALRFTFSFSVNSFFVEILQILHLGDKFKC